MKRQRSPYYRSSLRYPEIIVRSELAAGHRLRESFDYAGAIVRPVFVFQRSYVKERQIRVFGIILRRFIRIERAPRRVVLIDQSLEFSFEGELRVSRLFLG